jgi:predicted nucleic acid-binding Zn ribbon protein
MNNCINCGKETRNPKFCSMNCAAIVNNHLYPRRKRRIFLHCTVCGAPLDNRINKYCKECNPQYRDYASITLGSLQNLRIYQRNSRIRTLARKAYIKYHDKLECEICGYNKHIEVCHIKSISSFDPASTIADINDMSNLIGLCPTHHWEFDNNLLPIRKSTGA